MPNVLRNQLQPGDIILTFTEWSAPELFVSLGQLLTPTGGGSAKYTHAQIVVTPDANGAVRIAESHVSPQGPHVEYNPPTTPGTVFRLNGNFQADWATLADDAAGQAESLITYLNTNAANEACGKYNTLAAVYSLLRREKPDTKGSNVINAVDARTHRSGYFCSMFVVLCFQLAALAVPATTPLDCNPEAMSPASLHGYLKRHGTWWTKVGSYAG